MTHRMCVVCRERVPLDPKAREVKNRFDWSRTILCKACWEYRRHSREQGDEIDWIVWTAKRVHQVYANRKRRRDGKRNPICSKEQIAQLRRRRKMGSRETSAAARGMR